MPILLISLTLISGCSSIKELEIFKNESKRIPLNLENPDPIEMDSVGWIVITESNYKEVFERLAKEKKSVVLFGLTDDDYEKLAINFAQVRKYIILNRSLLQKYKDYYEGDQEGGEAITEK